MSDSLRQQVNFERKLSVLLGPWREMEPEDAPQVFAVTVRSADNTAKMHRFVFENKDGVLRAQGEDGKSYRYADVRRFILPLFREGSVSLERTGEILQRPDIPPKELPANSLQDEGTVEEEESEAGTNEGRAEQAEAKFIERLADLGMRHHGRISVSRLQMNAKSQNGKPQPGIVMTYNLRSLRAENKAWHANLLARMKDQLRPVDDSPLVTLLRSQGVRRAVLRAYDPAVVRNRWYTVADVLLDSAESESPREEGARTAPADDAESELLQEESEPSEMRSFIPEKGKRTPLERGAFEERLIKLRPRLYAFGYSLTRDHAYTEDLFQRTMVKAIANQEKFQKGTNLQAWTFTILRNTFLSDKRSSREKREFNGEGAETALLNASTLGNQEASLTLRETFDNMQKLPPEQRQALVLVAMRGYSYEEAAREAGCAVGTMKSRVNRARERLKELSDDSENEGQSE